MEEANVLQNSAVEGSRTTLDESAMPPPSAQRGLKRKSQDTEPALPVSTLGSLCQTSQHLNNHDTATLSRQTHLLTFCFSRVKMGALDQQQETQQPQGASNALQQLEPSAVELPPEETANISQLIELDLLGDKDKKKTDDDSDEEVCGGFTGGEVC